MKYDMYISLRCCDEETGKCASNLMSRQGEEVHGLGESVVGSCSSSVWVPSRHAYSRVPSEMKGDMYKCLRCCDEETGKCASNLMSGLGEEVHGLGQSVVNDIV